MAKNKAKPKENKKVTKGIKSIIGPIALLTIIFFLAQYAYQIYNNTDILNNGEVYDFFGKEVIRSGILDLSILYFLLVQALLIILYMLVVWLLVRLVGITFKWTKTQMRSWGIFIWIIFTLTLWITHEYFYPYSDFSIGLNFIESLGISLSPEQIKYAVLGAAGFCAFIGLFALLGLLVWFTKNIFKSIILLFIIGGCGYLYYQNMYLPQNMVSKAPKKLPNIILVNLDGLQTHQLKVFNQESKNNPNINNFLSQATVFTRNVTPSLQEFPVWLSIFTGEYPNKNGMFQNYMPIPEPVINQNLVKLVQNKGYTAAFVSDNSRTAKMRLLKSFDYINAPPANFSNLLIGESNDFIVSNLLTNTFVGQYLFPFSYGSREITESYDPHSLIDRVSQTIDKKSDNAMFLVINMTMARWPYGWRNSVSADYKPIGSTEDTPKNYKLYQNAVNMLDTQFNTIMTMLEEKGILQNSIVILFSAKGESFNNKETNLITMQNYSGTQDVSALVNMINSKQYFTKAFHTPIAIRLFNATDTNRTKPISAVTSSIDIFATIMDFIGADPASTQSRSLLPATRGQTDQLSNATAYFESGYNTDRLSIDNPNLSSYISKGLKLFNINCCTGAIQLTPDAINDANEKQSYGKVTYPNIIIKLPSEAGVSGNIIYNISDKTWTISNQGNDPVSQEQE